MENLELSNQPVVKSPAKDIQPPPLIVGVLRRTKNKLPLASTINLMAYMARQFNIELYFFTTKDFNPKDKTIQATLIDGSTQIEKIIPLPKLVYDPNGLWYEKEIKELLVKESYFFQYGWGGVSKEKIYSILSSDDRFKEFLIETHVVNDFKTFLTLFGQYHDDVVLKPEKGSMGENVVRIFAEKEKYIVLRLEKKILLNSVIELQNYYEENFIRRTQILQPYIISRTKYGNPFDIRVHTRRGAEGKFKIFPYPRCGRNPESILSNIATGGYTIPIVKFLKQEYGDDWKMIRDKLMYLGKNIPDLIQSFSEKNIFAMGIDVGIQRRDDSYELKIFEVNTLNPGISSIPIEAAFANLEYIQYLGKCLAEGTLKK